MAYEMRPEIRRAPQRHRLLLPRQELPDFFFTLPFQGRVKPSPCDPACECL